MRIRLEGHDMTKEEMVNEIVQLAAENQALSLKVTALTGVLIKKGLVTKEEITTIHKQIIDAIDNEAVKYGVNAEKFKEFVEDYLEINEKE